MSKRQKKIPQKPYLKQMKSGKFKWVFPKPIPADEFFSNGFRRVFESTVCLNPYA